MNEWSKEITTTTIRNFKMFIDILMIWRIMKSGWWETRIFTLYVFRNDKWKIEWIFKERCVLSAMQWQTSIRCVLWMIESSNIWQWVLTRKIKSCRITRDVRIEWMRCGWKAVILHPLLLFRFPNTLIINDSIGWLHNINSIDNLILVNTRRGVQNRWTKQYTIQRINGTRRWMLENEFMWRPSGFPTKSMQIYRACGVGGCDNSTDVHAPSPTSHCGARIVWWEADGGSLVTATLSVLDFVALTLRYLARGSNDSKICGFSDIWIRYWNLSLRNFQSISSLWIWYARLRKCSQNCTRESSGPFCNSKIFLLSALRSY